MSTIKERKTTPLKNVRVYLSGPIEHGGGPNWRIEPTKVLKNKFKVDLFDPFEDPKQQWAPNLLKARKSKRYKKMQDIAKKFVRKDLQMVSRSDLLIACLPFKVPTTGTIHEIIVAVNNKIPTLLVCPQGKENIPLWFYGFIPTDFMFGSWENLYLYLEEVNEYKHTDNFKWSFIYKLI